jgi:hypothetical protein
MFKKFSFQIIFMFFLVLFSLSHAESGEAERNIFLTQMLSLAEKSKPYCLINMGENKIQLIARGLVLREWTAEKIGFTHGYLPLQTLEVEKKSVQLSQLRHAEPIESEEDTSANTNVKNSNDNKTTGNGAAPTNKTENSRFPSLDIEDMPSDYQMFLKGCASINVVTHAESYMSVIKRYLMSPILALWPSSKKDGSAKIEVFFKDKTNSRTLFWAITEGMECLVVPSGYGDKKDFQF